MKPVILITGASQGIGSAIAKVFAQEVRGVRLALVARNGKNLQAVAKRCAKLGATAEAFVCDVADEAAVAAMVRRGRGDVFNMGSIAGRQAYPGGAAYCAAKFGVTGLTQVMREELKAKGVRVTLVCPGATVSPSWDGSGVAPERMMPAEDVARAFLDIYRLSRRTVVEEIVLRPQAGDI